ncbi:MAG: hypothetical protein DMD35_07010 [Gemmatimonadetes bacterium]|nr:MAG: hypothetical protein DMD35_07010 [Gemmatimonadota bacterium]
MTKSSLAGITRFAVAGLVGLGACSVDTATNALQSPTSPRLALGTTLDQSPELGKVKICKSASSNVSGTFTASRTQFVAAGFPTPGSPSGSVLATVTVAPGECVVIAEDNGGNGIASDVVINETSAGFVSATLVQIDALIGGGTATGAPVPVADGLTYRINQFHGSLITYVNTVNAPPPPPPEVCDFITFGRLVTTVDGQKVVISGNAGGNKPGGGILSEFHIEANGVDNHVAQVDTYGPITAGGALFGLTNSRITTGTAKNGVAVELRLWDGGEPGKGTDKVYVKLNGVELFGADGQFIDQGNMQFHSNCRGPK